MGGFVYSIVGKLLWSDLDAEGNLHIVLKNNNSFWAETSAKYLKSLEGKVLWLNVESKRARKEPKPPYTPLKNPQKKPL